MENKIHIEIVKHFDGTYSANVTHDIPKQGICGLPEKEIRGLPEYVDYRTLRKIIKEKIGFCLPLVSTLYFEKDGEKEYAYIVS